jgi:hypothetical protein
MHEVGSKFALGMRSDPAPPHGLTHGLTKNDACNDFRSQATLCRRLHECWRTQIPVGSVRPSRSSASARASFRFQALAFGRASVAPPHRSASVRVFVRNAWGNAHDLALAARVVRQPSAPPISHASRRSRQRFRARPLDRVGRAQCVDRVLGGHSISGRGMTNRSLVDGRWSFANNCHRLQPHLLNEG